MRLSFAARVAFSALSLASCAAFAAACGSSGSSGAAIIGGGGFGAGGGDAGADAADAGSVPDALAFVPAGTLTINPKATQILTVVTTPPGSFRVRFALLGSGTNSAPGDAALDANEVDTDASGAAQVTLTAPSMPTTFSVRASVGTRSVLLGVSVSARHYTSLRVFPSYSGNRPVKEWTATVSGGVTCGELTGNPPPDGDLSTSAAFAKPLVIDNIPVGIPLAVTLRAGHYIGGCADQSPLSEADGNQILVYASNRPLNLAATELDLSFGPTQPSSALSKLMSSTATQVKDALSNGAESDVTALLDAMRDATPNASKDAFSSARQMQSWDTALTTAFGTGAATRLRDPADRWLKAGLTQFFASDTFSGWLGALHDGALFKLATVAQVPAESAGFPSSFPVTWSTDSNDTLLFGTELDWIPSRLVSALAQAPALLEFPKASSVEAALAQSVDCNLVASTLLAHGSVAGSAAYDGCDLSCTVTACTAAVSALWKIGSSSSGSFSARLSVTGSGSTEVGDDASISSLDGSWLGQLQIAPDMAQASGPLSGTAKTQ
jgi:hypothetical protein